MNILIYLAAIVSGMVNPMQAGANAELRKTTGSALFSAVIVYSSGLLVVFLLQSLIRDQWPNTGRLSSVPWWAWLGGALSIVSTMAGVTLAQRLGSGVFTSTVMTASLIASILLDHFGLLGFEQHLVSWPRFLGACLMIAGLWLIGRF